MSALGQSRPMHSASVPPMSAMPPIATIIHPKTTDAPPDLALTAEIVSELGPLPPIAVGHHVSCGSPRVDPGDATSRWH